MTCHIGCTEAGLPLSRSAAPAWRPSALARPCGAARVWQSSYIGRPSSYRCVLRMARRFPAL
ncbi:hypothetical protein, partial [Microvirga aerophila]|uniref:hypothetical protein n=1 Tax=Microvirga aerophila TaxID=670291 RepID=UPI001AED1B53